MRFITLLFWILVIIVGIVFTTQNSYFVHIHYYFNSIKVYMPLLLLTNLLMGVLLGILAMFPLLLKSRRFKRKSKQSIKNLEQEIKNLRTIPIKDSH